MAPIRVLWDGEVFRPFGRSQAACEKLEPLATYNVLLEGDWSAESHSHFFARLTELYDNLPEHIASHFKNVGHFRSWALIHEGFCTEVCQIEANHVLALHAAKAIGKVAPYAVVQVDGNMVRTWIPKSQARSGGMSKKEWERAKQAVLELAEHLVNGGELAA
jgi:hypothetical protein